MNTWRLPAFTMAILYMAFLGFVAKSSLSLPPQMASHFNASGEPDAWMSTEAYLRFIALFGAALPLLWVVIPQVIRYLPAKFINLPNHDYWLAPERREGTDAWLARHFLWFGSMQVALAGGIHLAIYQANQSSPARMSGGLMLGLLGLFLVGAGLWAVTMIRHFQRDVPAAGKS
jgi:hypothetical protein